MTIKSWFQNFFNKNNNFLKVIDNLSKEKIFSITGIHGSSQTLFISNLYKNIKKPIIYLCSNDNDALNASIDIETFGIEKCYYFPSIGLTPYHNGVVNEEINSLRLEVLKKLLINEDCIICTSVYALLFHIIPKDKLLNYIYNFKKNNNIDIDELSKKLIQSGYEKVKTVSEPGQFSIRGNIIDIYYSVYKNPIRIELFDNIVESIRSFNPITQKSEKFLDEIIIPPHKEILFNETDLTGVYNKLQEINSFEKEKQDLLEKFRSFKRFDGEQFYLNLFYEKKSLCNYFNEFTLIIDDINNIENRTILLYKEFYENYNQKSNQNKIRIPVENILFSLEEIFQLAKNVIKINLLHKEKDENFLDFGFKGIPAYPGNLELFKNDIKNYIKGQYKIILFAGNEIQSERLQTIFKELNPVDDRINFNEIGFSIVPLTINAGFISENDKTIFLTDYEIFGKKSKISKHFYTKRTEKIESFFDLKQGDYVVHINHGIGQFIGIERIKSFGTEKDYIAILYADDDKILIPVEQLNIIQKYISLGLAKPKLDKIGSRVWSKTKEKVKKSIEELASELIKLYSVRLKSKGFAFAPDTPWQKEFEAKFPYEETKDQLISIEEVKKDMESQKVMDRLICGDVGFGKTEVALRASFKAVMSGKQVIVLVPTTLLAEQHYETFKDRLIDYPIKVEMLSRFRTEQEQKKIILDLEKGSIDIIIGTHRLLSDDIKFKNPGLLIIDEEHKFGVKHKEKIKSYKKNLDCLSMTATPIPRTLHMSLVKIRDISIINTPPKERTPIETYVLEFNENILIEAIKNELNRGGQVFFLHNKINTIYNMENYINQIVPQARTIVAHGKMNEEDLEDIVHKFIHYEYDILITTTIIEAGIDIPKANTIIINNADRFGLSQLYQLRGRVGRSNIKAYCYLFYEPDKVLTEDAMKRLRIISEYTELGSGFKIAMKDLEIRGAGNIFGPEQSGNILAVGFHLYCKLLNEAIKELSKQNPDMKDQIIEEKEVYLELSYTGYIPDNYISTLKEKIEFYKKIAGVVYKEEIEEIRNSLIDRYGPIPEQVESLLFIAEIRILCKQHHINEIIEKSDKIEIKFDKISNINIEKLMNLIYRANGNVYLLAKSPDSIFIKIDKNMNINDKWSYIKSILEKILN